MLNETWSKFSNCSINVNLDDHEIFEFQLIGSKIFALRDNPVTDKVAMFDTRRTEMGWTWLPSLNRAGSFSFNWIINHGGVLYVFDLRDKYYECYNEELKQWTCVKPENWPASIDTDASLVSHDGLIYATCTSYTDMTMKEFYSFDPTSATWKRLANFLSKPLDHFLLSLGNSLIKLHPAFYEIYDIEDNKTWETIEVDDRGMSLWSPCIVNKSLLDKSHECNKI